SELERRLSRGDRCYGAAVDGRFAHFSWVQVSGRHRLFDAGRSVSIAARHSWIYNCHTASWARGRRAYPLTLTRILNDALTDPAATVWIYTSTTNIASQRGIESVGFARRCVLTGFSLGPWRLPLPVVRAA